MPARDLGSVQRAPPVSAGGPECLWVGHDRRNAVAAPRDAFRDYREICRRAEDDHARQPAPRATRRASRRTGRPGKLVHGLLGWDKLAPESMALYQHGRRELPTGVAAGAGSAALGGRGHSPAASSRGGITSTRTTKIAGCTRPPLALSDWYAATNDSSTGERQSRPSGSSTRSETTTSSAAIDADVLVDQPQRGFTQALTRARIPYVLVHADDIERDAPALKTLVLPNLGVMTSAQIDAVRAFVRSGGGLVATGATSLLDEWGDGASGLRACRNAWRRASGRPPVARRGATPALGGGRSTELPSPQPRTARRTSGPAHGRGAESDRPSAPRPQGIRPYRPSRLWRRTRAAEYRSIEPGAPDLRAPVPRLSTGGGVVAANDDGYSGPGDHGCDRSGRVAYLAADLDRRYARDNLGDTGTLLANLVRWTARDDIPLDVTGPGLLDCHLYPTVEPVDSALRQSHQRGDLARSRRRADSGRARSRASARAPRRACGEHSPSRVG